MVGDGSSVSLLTSLGCKYCRWGRIYLVKRNGRDDFTSLRLTVHGRHARPEWCSLSGVCGGLTMVDGRKQLVYSYDNIYKEDAVQIPQPRAWPAQRSARKHYYREYDYI